MVGLKMKPKRRGIFGDATVASILGLTVSLPPGGTDKQRDKKIVDAIEKPAVYTNGGSVIRSRADSLYAIELLVKKGGKFVPPDKPADNEGGRAFVKIARTEVYAVRIINDADHEVAVTLTIDGLSMFTFSKFRRKDGGPLYSSVLVPAKKSMLVSGWHIDNEASEEFLVTSFAKSAAAEVRATGDIGTITATFAAAWPIKGGPPADEPAAPSKRAKSADATGRVRRFEKKWIEVPRHFGVTRDTVSVRYSK